LGETAGGRVHFICDQEPGAARVDIAALVASVAAQGHLQCCGPLGLLQSFEAAAAHSPAQVHIEYFSAKEAPATAAVAHSCSEGVCSTCETAVLDGTPDHRDVYLSDHERPPVTGS
jgi:vanillate O-demethylase ferredoxin subunit